MEKKPQPLPLLTAREVAAHLGVTEAYVRKRTRQRTLPAVNIRGGCPDARQRPAWRYDLEQVLAVIEQTPTW